MIHIDFMVGKSNKWSYLLIHSIYTFWYTYRFSSKKRLRFSQSEWNQAQQETSKKVDCKIKDPSILPFFKGVIYEFTR